MKELKDITRAYEEAWRDGKRCALATVVRVEGSAYRRPGARMLVREDGGLTGAISGGCLEGDALRKAQLSMLQNKRVVVTYDSTDEEEGLGIGLGCNGIISILIEPINPEEVNNPLELLKFFFLHRSAAVLVTVFTHHKKIVYPGTCLLMNEDGSVRGAGGNNKLEKLILDDAQEALRSRTSIIMEHYVEEPFEVFCQFLEPPLSILLFGAGNDAIPLCKMADILGWETTIIDSRPGYATRKRFPLSKEIIVARAGLIRSFIRPDRHTIALLMTHNYAFDIIILAQLLPFQLAYIGALGPKKKLTKMLDELRANGIMKQTDDTSNLFGPVGLDIGAETSEEIALSIISEIKAVLSGKTGLFLKEKTNSIHSPSL